VSRRGAATEEVVRSEVVYDGKIIRVRRDRVVVRLPGEPGTEKVREVVEHGGAAAVVAVDEEGRVALVRQYRYPVSRALWEIPAGRIKEGETPEECIAREIEEETSYRAGEISLLAEFYSSPGFATERMSVYLARRLRPGDREPDEGEHLEVRWVPFDEAVEAAAAGRCEDAKTIVGLCLARLKLEKGLDG